MARNLLQDRPTETVMPISRSTSRAKRASTLAGDHAVQALGAGEIEEGLVDRERLDQRRQRLHGLRAPRGRRGHISPCRAGSRVACGQSAQRLEHRHRRAHAVGARDVAGGRDHAALAAADDHRLVGERRDRRASRPWRRRRRSRYGRCVSVCERAMADEARRAAGGRSAVRAFAVGQAVAAEARGRQGAPRSRHVALPGGIAERLRARPRRWSDAVRAASANAFTVASSRSTRSSTPARKSGRAAALRSVSGPMPVAARKRPSRSGSPAMKDKRLNRNDFSDFARVVNRLFQAVRLPFR